MRRFVITLGAAALLGLMAGCEDYGCGPYGDQECYGPYYGHDYGYGPYGRDYGPAPYAGPGAYDYDGFYDDYYGPFFDGYWAPDGFFYYSRGLGDGFHRDVGGHFRHDSAAGFHAVHGGAHRP